jgi:UDP-glucuronate 4-epimerase
MTVLITGCAGFIGFSLASKLIKKKIKVVGVDNINSYYSQKLKLKRIEILKKKKKFLFYKKDCSDNNFLNFILKYKNITTVFHFAAEVGVRNSFSKPGIYYKNNIKGFYNVLEFCRLNRSNLIFASSSSVYGASKKKTFKETDETSLPISFYAATKKCNEVMAAAYSKNYRFSAVGVRFFNVYGPWGRPDMSIYKFTAAMQKNKYINIYGNGNQIRDFTYIDDAINLIEKIMEKQKKSLKNKFDVFNSGRGQCIKINDLVRLISKKIKKIPKIKKTIMQKGDVFFTNSSSRKIIDKLNFRPKISLVEGIDNFIKWHASFK